MARSIVPQKVEFKLLQIVKAIVLKTSHIWGLEQVYVSTGAAYTNLYATRPYENKAKRTTYSCILLRSSRPEVFCKNVFWEISLIWQENTAPESFVKKHLLIAWFVFFRGMIFFRPLKTVFFNHLHFIANQNKQIICSLIQNQKHWKHFQESGKSL